MVYRRLQSLLGVGSIAVLISLSTGAFAQTFTYTTADSEIISGTENSGFWSTGATNSDWRSTYMASEHYGLGGTYRDYFSFYLDGLSGEVTSATLHLKTFYISAGGGGLGLWDVSTPAATLRLQHLGPDADIVADLGSGVNYGMFTLSDGQSAGTVDLVLNAAALADIQSHAGGWFSIGGAFAPVMTDGYAFNTSENTGGENRLIITTSPRGGGGATPVSGTATTVIGASLAGLGALRRRSGLLR